MYKRQTYNRAEFSYLKLFTTSLQGSLPTKDLERSEGRFVCKIGLFPRERCLAPGGGGQKSFSRTGPKISHIFI